MPPRQVEPARFEPEPEPEPEPASGSFWKFGSAAADAEAAAPPKSIDVYGPALAQLMQMVAEMQRGQREVTNRLNSQAEELAITVGMRARRANESRMRAFLCAPHSKAWGGVSHYPWWLHPTGL